MVTNKKNISSQGCVENPLAITFDNTILYHINGGNFIENSGMVLGDSKIKMPQQTSHYLEWKLEEYNIEKNSYTTPTLESILKEWEGAGKVFYHLYNNNIKLDDKIIAEIPYIFSELYKEIEASKYILDLKDDWDDAGSPGYDKNTWIKTIQFLVNYSQWFFEKFNRIIYTPKIYPGAKKDIDLLWEKDSFRLLIRINESGESGMFYADNHKEQITEGQFNIKDINYQLLPLPIEV